MIVKAAVLPTRESPAPELKLPAPDGGADPAAPGGSRRYGIQPGRAAACFTQRTSCASSISSCSWTWR